MPTEYEKHAAEMERTAQRFQYLIGTLMLGTVGAVIVYACVGLR